MTEKSVVDKMLKIGLGIAAYGEEKVADFLKEVTEKGEAKRADIEKVKKDFKKKSGFFRKEIARRIDNEVGLVLKRMNLATAKEIAALKKRIDKLESEKKK